MTQRSVTLFVGFASAAIAATAICTTPASAASASPNDSVAEMSAQWLAKDRGLPIETARDRIAAQEGLSTKAAALEKSLGARAAGSWIDQDSGRLIVNVLDGAAAKAVQAKGATPRVVANDGAELATAEKSAKAAAGRDFVSSHVDPTSNKVVLTVPADKVAATRAKVDAGRVTVEGTEARMTTQANVYGGQQIEFSGYVCSLGFNATRGGSPVFITAGHCAEGYQTFNRNGTYLGRTQAYSFPGNDYAYSSLASGWSGIGAVDLYNGTARRVTGYSNAAVGTAVCKSGRTTRWTCGSVQAKNATVNYNNGDGTYSTVSGLTKSNTCTEGGDSGGSWLASTLAQGVTSGGAGYGVNGVCGEKVGQPNIAYFQPVGEILSVYGLTLKTS